MGLMNLLTGGLLEGVKDIVDEFVTTDKERFEYQLKQRELDLREEEIQASLLEKVHETNIAEAKTGNWFIAGWRPFLGWVGGTAIAYHYVGAPFLHSLFTAFNIDFPLPQLDLGMLLNLVLTMLGMAGIRTYEKIKGVHDKH